MGRILDYFYKDIHLHMAFTQSHRPEKAIPDSYDKCEPVLLLFLDISYS